jgi:hypothetical protein
MSADAPSRPTSERPAMTVRELDPLELRFPAAIDAVPRARHRFSHWLTAARVDRPIRDELALVITELVTNAVEASPGPQCRGRGRRNPGGRSRGRPQRVRCRCGFPDGDDAQPAPARHDPGAWPPHRQRPDGPHRDRTGARPHPGDRLPGDPTLIAVTPGSARRGSRFVNVRKPMDRTPHQRVSPTICLGHECPASEQAPRSRASSPDPTRPVIRRSCVPVGATDPAAYGIEFVRTWSRCRGYARDGLRAGRPIAYTLAYTLPALVAQLDRASDYGSEGREFESLRAR